MGASRSRASRRFRPTSSGACARVEFVFSNRSHAWIRFCRSFKILEVIPYNHNVRGTVPRHWTSRPVLPPRKVLYIGAVFSRNLPLSQTSRFVFALPEGTSSGLTVASALVCKAAKEGEGLNDKGKPIIRPYTPVTAPDVTDKLELLIKHYQGGAFTEYLWKLKPGDSVAMKGERAGRLTKQSFRSR